jgi:hypothetical protein
MPLLVTLLVILAAAALLGVYDVWLFARGGVASTISHQVLAHAREAPILPLAVGLILGILLGHLFWPQHTNQ